MFLFYFQAAVRYLGASIWRLQVLGLPSCVQHSLSTHLNGNTSLPDMRCNLKCATGSEILVCNTKTMSSLVIPQLTLWTKRYHNTEWDKCLYRIWSVSESKLTSLWSFTLEVNLSCFEFEQRAVTLCNAFLLVYSWAEMNLKRSCY